MKICSLNWCIVIWVLACTFQATLNQPSRLVTLCSLLLALPPANGQADLSYVEGVARELAHSLNGRKVVVEKSTVPVRTCEALERTMVLNGADRNSFTIALNPQFLREGTAVYDFLYPDRIVIGVDCDHSAEVLKEIY